MLRGMVKKVKSIILIVVLLAGAYMFVPPAGNFTDFGSDCGVCNRLVRTEE